MTALAPTLEAFFTERLIRQLQASPQTIASYRDTMRLLLTFIQQRTGKPQIAHEFIALGLIELCDLGLDRRRVLQVHGCRAPAPVDRVKFRPPGRRAA